MSDARVGQAGAAASRRAIEWLRWLHPLLWWLVLVWFVSPEDRSRTFRLGLVATYAVLLAVVATRPLRKLAADRLGPMCRWLDVAAVNVAGTIALAEIATALLAAATSSPLFAVEIAGAADRIRHQRYRPNALHHGRPCNSLGYVDDEFSLPRRPGTRRIVALGDSFAVGVVPYEQNFLTLLDGALDASCPTEVLNFGVSATGPAEYLHLWRVEARHYQPDLVLLCFFVGNDFVGHRHRSLLHPSSWRCIALCRRVWRLVTADVDFGTGSDMGPMQPDTPTFTPADFLAIEQDRVSICRQQAPGPAQDRIDRTFALLDQLAAEAGDRLRVVLIPDEFQVDDGLWAGLTAADAAAFERDLPNRLLANFWRQRSVPCLDLLPAIRAAAGDGPVYKPRDTHWNARGNEAAAAAIARWLRSEG